MLELVVVALFCLLGVATQRVIGFGIAAFLSPVTLIFFEPAQAVIITILVGTLSCSLILYQSRQHSAVIMPVVLRIFLAGIPGLLIGSYIVTRIDKGLLQIFLGMVVIAGVLIQEYFFPKPTKKLAVNKGINVTGFFAGLFNATAANGAPPMALWMRAQISTPDQIRQNIAAIFMFINLSSTAAILAQKPEVFNNQTFTTFVLLVPVIILANLLGGWLMKKVNRKLYEKLVVVCIILTGLVTIGLGIIKVT